jgi:sulfite exporter TauE/SafE
MLEAESNQHIARHEKLASSVTLFQIGIAISAIAVLTKRRLFWFVGLAFGCAGMIFLAFSYR